MNPYNQAGGGGGGGGANPFGAPATSAGYGQQPGMGYGYEEQGATGYDQGGNYGQQQQAAGYGPQGARPRVDVEASGEVDPNL